MKKSLALLLTGLIFLISCGTKTQTDGKKGNGGNITFNVEAEPTSLDPQLLTDIAAFNIDSLAYEALVRLNEKNEIVPAGAESWNISDEGKTWTFKIRQGMKWSNGDTVTANDYLRGVKRALEPETGAEYAFLMYYIEGAEDYNKGNSKDFNKVGVKVKDDYTIEFKLAKPTPYFGKLLVMPVYFPANEKVLTEHKEKYATEAGNSVYNGPYIIKEWIHDNKVVLEKNPDYWDAKNIKADTLTALMTSDYEAATNLFKNKELDFTRVSVEKKAEFDGKPELKAFPEGRVYFIGFNQNHPALKNKKVRATILGVSNVGKSSIINLLLKDDRITTSKYSGTTLKSINNKVPDTQITIVDTPGLIPVGRVSDLISVESGLKLVPAGEISRKTFKLEENQVFMFDVFCRFKILEANSGYKTIFSALLKGDFFQILSKSEKERYFENKFVTKVIEVKENEELVIAGLGWINVKRGTLKVEIVYPEAVKVVVREAIFKSKKN